MGLSDVYCQRTKQMVPVGLKDTYMREWYIEKQRQQRKDKRNSLALRSAKLLGS